MSRLLLGSVAIFTLAASAAANAQAVTPEAIETAMYEGGLLPETQSPLTVKVQVLLDRADISPGVIDGIAGGMSLSAIQAFETREGLPVDGLLDEEVWAALGGDTETGLTEAVIITADDLVQVVGPLPDDYAEMAELTLLGYERPSEALAEKYHMDEEFLVAMNSGSSFAEGETITVAATRASAEAEIASITINTSTQRLIAKDANGEIVSNYPVAVGSDQTPSPSGSHTVNGVAIDPTYAYNPEVNFQQGDNTEPLEIPPGPNGPVGSVWIDLSKPTYGIHGTPRPATLFSAQSHGCVRMTNWDARELASMVKPGVTVDFVQ